VTVIVALTVSNYELLNESKRNRGEGNIKANFEKENLRAIGPKRYMKGCMKSKAKTSSIKTS
jgi:hypothetical protein